MGPLIESFPAEFVAYRLRAGCCTDTPMVPLIESQETRVNSHLPQSRISRNSAVGCSSYTTGTLFLLGETECTPQRRNAAGTWLPCCLLRKLHLDESIRFKLAVSALPLPRSLAHTRFGATVLYEDCTKSSRSRVSEQQCCMKIKAKSRTMALQAARAVLEQLCCMNSSPNHRDREFRCNSAVRRSRPSPAEVQCRSLALKAVRACGTESSRCLQLAFRSSSVEC